MTTGNFRVGDRVRRIADVHVGMSPGDVGTVIALHPTGEVNGVQLVGWLGRTGDAWHNAANLELVPTAAPIGKASNPKDSIGDRKVPLWLLSPIAKAKWSLAQFAGMCKYGAWNWRIAGVRSSVYLSAMQRHLDAYTSGEELDPVDGTDHLANVMACCALLIDAKAAGKLTDDRPPSVDLRAAYKGVEDQMAVLKEQYKDMAPRHYTIEDTVA